MSTPLPVRLSLLLVAALLSACASSPQSNDVVVYQPPAPAPVVEAPPLSRPAGSDKTRIRARTRVLDVWMLDIGQGACTFIACPDGKSNVVIDCGTAKAGGTDTQAIADWINAKNARATNVTLLVSHGHEDHYSNFTNNRIHAEPFTQVLLGGLERDYPTTFQQWVKAAQEKPVFFGPAEFVANDARFACGAAKFDLLTVNATEVDGVKAEEKKENADSAVVRLSYAGHSIVFPGDAEGPTEQSALANARAHRLDLRDTTLLVSSHHGAKSGGSNSVAWLARLTPQAGLFSANVSYDTYSHPTCDRVDEFERNMGGSVKQYQLSCGKTAGQTTVPVTKRLFNTYDNGHVRARFSASGVSYACEEKTAACDAQLAPEEMP